MKLPQAVKSIYEILRRCFVKYQKDNCSFMAAAVSYYTFLSVMPIVLLAVSSAAYIFGSASNAQSLVLVYISSFSPGLTADSAFGIKKIIAQVIRDRGTATGIGLILLAWSGSSAFTALEQSLNFAWEVKKPRNFLRSRLVSFIVMVFISIILIISVLITTALKTLKDLNTQIFGITPANWPLIWKVVGFAVPFLITTACFFVIYYILPKAKVPWKAAFLASITASILWEAAKQGFSYYIIHFAKQSAVYGSLGSIILFLGWIYCSVVVIIFGAELSSVLYNNNKST